MTGTRASWLAKGGTDAPGGCGLYLRILGVQEEEEPGGVIWA